MKNRPKGILVFAVLSLMGGVAMILLLLATPTMLNGEAEPILAQVGLSQGYLMGFFGLIGALTLASGIGMIKGTKWGWWLAVFVFAFAVLRAANSMLNIQAVAAQFGATPDEVSEQYIKFGGRMITNSLVIWYFFSNRVLSYFQMETTAKWKKLGLLVGVTITFGVVLSVIAAILGVGF